MVPALLRLKLLLTVTTSVGTAIFCPPPRAAAASADAPPVALPAEHRAFFKTHCHRCHAGDTAEAGVRLDTLPLAITDIPTAERWQKILGVLNAGEMPPEDEPQPAPAHKAAVLEILSETMVTARRALSDTGGIAAIRRLNRREYQNTIRELLGVEIDVEGLPADSNPGGFDTAGGGLFFSSDQFEQYLTLARQALDRALAASQRSPPQTVRVEAEDEANRRVRMIFRGYQKHGYIAWKKWQASKGKPASDFGFVDDKELEFRKLVWDRESPDFADYLAREETRTGALLTVSNPNPQAGLVIPDEAPAGRYLIRARLGVLGKPDPPRSFVEIGFRGESIESAIDLIACRRVTRPMRNPEILEIAVDLPPVRRPASVDVGSQTGKRVPLGERVIVFRQRHVNSREAARFIRYQSIGETGFGVEPTIWIDWLEWEGPLVAEQATAEAVRPLVDLAATATGSQGPDEADVRALLAGFGMRAFRGTPVRPGFLKRLMTLYRDARHRDTPFLEAIKEPLAVMLASPSFLYLAEPVTRAAAAAGDGTGAVAITPSELAARLSYFLWSGPPDAALLQQAADGRLSDARVLAAEVDRLLADERARQFVSGFTHQWLDMERLDFFQFNHRLFPDFDDSVKAAARQEVYETLLQNLREDRPVRELLDADTVVINDLLADYYGIAGVKGHQFREVAVPDGLPRGGLLGMAAILAMGSDGERSSPVERGAWVLRKLLHDPPPPAPANVPQLSRHAGELLSARGLLTAHMEEPQCFQCHRRIDPIGFGLEHFDAVGRWRETEYTEVARNNRVVKSKRHPIDATGKLPDGVDFDGFFELRKAVARQHEAFARGLIEHLIAYGLGRPSGFADAELAASILAHSGKSGLTIKSMIEAIVQSEAFRTKRFDSAQPPRPDGPAN